MYRVKTDEVQSSKVEAEGAKNTTIQWLLDESCGVPNFALRRFVIGPEGHTPLHSHDWEHEVYMLRGEGVLISGDGEISIKADQAIFIEPGELHQFRCRGTENLEMLCLVPLGPATDRS